MNKKSHIDLFYEDVEVDDGFETARHTVTDADILAFAEVTRDRHPLHTDPEYCARTQFGRPIAHGLFGLSLMEGLKAETKVYENTSIASLGWDKVRFLKPVFSGDTVHARVRFTHKRPSRSPDRGIITEWVELINQKDEVVISAEHASLLKVREPQAAGA
jgi:acyl dehydratase